MCEKISPAEVKEHFDDNQTIMVAGFLEVGAPENLVDLLLESGVSGINLITNDGGFVDASVGSLMPSEMVEKAICCHIGTNKQTVKRYNSGDLEVELIPQGTLIEMIRAGGAGLGGILTPVGVGTEAAEGKRIIEFQGEEHILARPLTADVALVKGFMVDEEGNMTHRKAARNYNPVMATAADTVIAEAEEVVQVGEIDQEEVMTPGIFVDYLLID